MSLAETPIQPGTIGGSLHRIVESQVQVATSRLCASLEDADLLEAMLDAKSKPRRRAGTEHLHYLLATPFRYPPLRHGSRFGSTTERGVWYGSEEIETAMAEVAFYRLLFLAGTQAEIPHTESQHTLYAADVATDFGCDLTLPRVTAAHPELFDGIPLDQVSVSMT